MEQLSIFDFIREDGIDIFFQKGAMYAYAPQGSLLQEELLQVNLATVLLVDSLNDIRR